MFFESWQALGRVLVAGLLAYISLVVLLRISGNRTLSKLNAFDFVVTIALGSTLATVLLSKDVAFAEGALSFALLIGLQFVVTWSSARSRRVSRLVKAEPILLVHRGELLPGAMRRARVAEDEILAVLRSRGVADLESVAALVLESDASMSVLEAPGGSAPTLQNVKRLRDHHLPLQ